MKLSSPFQLISSIHQSLILPSLSVFPLNNVTPKQKWILAIALTLIGILLTQSININDDAFDLLPGSAVRGDLELLHKLGLVNRVIISLTQEENSENRRREKLKTSGRKLGEHLESSDLFTNVIYHLPEKFELDTFHNLQPLTPLLLDAYDLATLESLTTPEAVNHALKERFALLNSPAGYGMTQYIRNDPLSISALVLEKLKYLRAEYSLVIEDGLFLSKDKRSCLIIAESTMKLTDSDSAAHIDEALKNMFKTSLSPGITPTVIGSLPHTLANANTVKRDLQTLLPLATVLLLTLVFITLKHIRALLVLAVPFLAAPSAIALTGLIHGEVSALALGFGVVLLGIAMDFAIHLYLGLAGDGNREVFLQTVRKPLLLATLTTTSVFLVLLFSEVESHRQMATLALSGVILAVFYSWYLIPLVVRKKSPALKFAQSLPLRPAVSARYWILSGWILLVIFGAISWPGLRYNGNLQNLDAPDPAILHDENQFRNTWGGKGEQVFVVARGKHLDQALEKNYLIFQNLRTHNALSFQSIAPMLPSLHNQRENLLGWKNFWQTRSSDFRQLFDSRAEEIGFSPTAFSPFFTTMVNTPEPVPLVSHLPDGLKLLVNAMIRTPQQQQSMGGQSEYLITTTVSADEQLYPLLLALDNNNRDITLLANKKWRAQVEKLLRSDIIKLSLAAGAIISLITFISFRSIPASAAALAPVISALAAMTIFSSVTGRELNMMHLLMGIMVIGLAVDYGIFTVCAQNKTAHSPLAVSLCAMSSLVGFGVLSFAHHPALNALGITVLIGIGTAWPTAIWVSPVILTIGNPLEKKKQPCKE